MQDRAHVPVMSPLTLLHAFLAAVRDPDGGQDLLRLHAQDTLICHGRRVRKVSAVDPADFARSHRETCELGGDQLPHFRIDRQADAHDSTPIPTQSGSVTWFQVTEIHSQREWHLAFGVKMSAGGLLVGWCTFAQRIASWSYADGMAQSIADYPWVRKAEPCGCRVLLDASYFRLQWRAPVAFNTLPDARFSCRMSTACCKHDYEITLPAEAQLLIDVLPWSKLRPGLSGTRLAAHADGTLQLKAVNESCRFLGSHNLCGIHRALGRQPFGACCVFPFSFASTPQGVDVAMSPVCGSVRAGFGLRPTDCTDELLEKLIHVEPRHADQFLLAPDQAVPWESFRDIEKGLCDCLATADLPLRGRLQLASRVLGALVNGESIAPDLWVNEPAVPITSELREAIRGMLGKVLGWDRKVLRSLPPVPEDLHQREAHDPVAIAVILRNTLFSKVYSYPYDLSTALNIVIVLYLLALQMEAAAAGPLSEAMWQELGSLGVHGLLKQMLNGVPDDFRRLFGTPVFGQWMLAA